MLTTPPFSIFNPDDAGSLSSAAVRRRLRFGTSSGYRSILPQLGELFQARELKMPPSTPGRHPCNPGAFSQAW